MTEQHLEALRANLGRHTGKARTRPLVELGRALADAYWRAGPGTPAAGPYLDEAIRMLDEAHGHLEPGEFLRGQVAGQLGWLVGARAVVPGGPEHDGERGIQLLDEALAFPELPQIMQAVARLNLGQLLLSRTMRRMQSGDVLMRAMQSGLPQHEVADIDRAVAHIRHVADGPTTNADMTAAARTLLGMAEAVQTLISGLGGPGGVDFGRMMQAMSTMQDLQRRAAAQPPGTGFGFRPNLFRFEVDTVVAVDPLERPVTVFDGPAPAAPAPARARTSVAAPRTSAAALRTALLGTLPGPGFASILALLGPDATAPDVHVVDELIALASSLVEAPDAVGTDHLLLAVALHLRARVDGDGGWGGDGADDVRAAGDSLITAMPALVREPADTVAVGLRLATLLDERLPARGIGTRLREGFAGVVAALRTVDADGLIYPTSSGERLLLAAGTGRLEYLPAGAGLPARVLVAGDRPVPDASIVSHVRSGAQVIELTNRTGRPLTESAAFVANPRRDRPQASVDAMLLRRTFYPRSAGLGDTVENVHGAGTVDDVLPQLNASMLHLGCGITADGGLELAGSAVLDPAEIAVGNPATAGRLAVLPPTVTGASALTEALLASRFLGVIGFRDRIPDEMASLMYFLLHAQLVDRHGDPARSVAAVRGWLRDPHRAAPDHLPTWYEAAAAAPDLADPVCWGALVHHGV